MARCTAAGAAAPRHKDKRTILCRNNNYCKAMKRKPLSSPSSLFFNLAITPFLLVATASTRENEACNKKKRSVRSLRYNSCLIALSFFTSYKSWFEIRTDILCST